MTLRISRSAVQLMLRHALENQSAPVCGLLAGSSKHLEHAQPLACTALSNGNCRLDPFELRQILADWRRRGLVCEGVYFTGQSPLDEGMLNELSGVPLDRLWRVMIDMDTKGRLDMHAFRGNDEEAPMLLCEEGETQGLYPARACD